MEIFPAIDIKDGQVVRLSQGDFDRSTVYGTDPAAVAASFARKGARWLHVVDLDGAKNGAVSNLAAIERIVGTFPGKVQAGGGIRTPETAALYLERGVERLVLGTGALTDPAFLSAMLKNHPGRFYVGLDVRNNRIAISGWLSEVSGDPRETMAVLAEKGVSGFVYTDILKDGMLGGPNLPVYRELARTLPVPVIASGGIGALSDIRALLEAGVAGAIVGRALYTGSVDLSQALTLAASGRTGEPGEKEC
ncbi:MAG: 1-(5-phosphoribosyl)-5-[(5-phosphoribosylamino)methylideneamino]imidazole-4-carboxamide isomerase [Nitrospirae bacterium]|nr:MAG: 1-(5-phosphoribosyl)-5-[(5-phosphoribosylamino)methylideneamino] imidazole-4-carboxamide isomerase [Leptospirillum sp. Group IV 'UBA BS']MCL4485808.1 1-(5-phosphoribosyl)-5-[(5-phosphoribosylamino)methylideneamino]imidazole-4-carboxamide isomerase [Nitrospirota bacterium]MCL5285237.1 1-(5-phosphoribosyl)-5-[(5-phosphoribosylamino)methylideneamino]imidazole-4-carboxamide isomerase [Nitrospirota bacterium]